ncbi:MAG: hypothetical protein D3925_01070 [Candidatus Electrothrix sp. AR5]|nr:hypothetical protein [Candidatus Electrothrix sp. AR5]
MASDKTGLTEEELMILALNDMFQFFYPHAEKSWQPVPDDKVRQIYTYTTQNKRPNSAMMDPEKYRDFLRSNHRMWVKEKIFLRKEDVDRVIAQDPYGYIKKHAASPHGDNQQHPGRIKKKSSRRSGELFRGFTRS